MSVVCISIAIFRYTKKKPSRQKYISQWLVVIIGRYWEEHKREIKLHLHSSVLHVVGLGGGQVGISGKS